MNVSKRIRIIGDFILPTEIIADIGADHGLLELYLLGKYKNLSITAIENKIGPYQILDHSLRAFKNVRLSMSDGLTAVDQDVNTVVIAGMGGLNIKNILDAYPLKVEKINKFVIDAHRDIALVRKTLIDYRFKIEEEKIVYEQGKYYVVNVFIKSNEPLSYTEDEIAFGYKLYLDPLWVKYRKYLISQNNKTISLLKDTPNLQDKILELKKINERLINYGKN